MHAEYKVCIHCHLLTAELHVHKCTLYDTCMAVGGIYNVYICFFSFFPYIYI